MEIKGVGIGRGVAVGSVIRMAVPLPEPSDAPRADTCLLYTSPSPRDTR